MMKLIAFLVLSLAGVSVSGEDLTGHHNMLLFGKETLYMSHLPAYSMAKHRFQGVYEIDLGEKANEFYLKHKEESKKLLYGLSPSETFKMTDVKEGFSFRAGLIPAHPESGTAVVASVKVNVVKRIHFHAFDDLKERPKQLTYFSVGKEGNSETFLVHLLTTPTVIRSGESKKDQFDHILQVKMSNPETSKPIEVPAGKLIEFAGRSDTFAERINLPEEDIEAYEASVELKSGESTKLSVIPTGEDIRLHTGGDVTIVERR